MFRPKRTTVSLAIAAEPAEKPDARFLALALRSPPPLISQCISPDHLTLTIVRSKCHVRIGQEHHSTAPAFRWRKCDWCVLAGVTTHDVPLIATIRFTPMASTQRAWSGSIP